MANSTRLRPRLFALPIGVTLALVFSAGVASAQPVGDGFSTTTKTKLRAREDSETPPLPATVDQLKEGQSLFLRDWLKKGSPNGALGDGLGPMVNAASCVACHSQGAPGGGGDRENNVDLLSVVLNRNEKQANGAVSTRLEMRTMSVHPGFTPGGLIGSLQTNVVLHKSLVKKSLAVGGPSSSLDTDYEKWRNALLRTGQKDELNLQHPVRKMSGFQLRFSQRNTPALFGAGLIDAIPDHLIVAIADEQAKKTPETKGRVPRDGSGRIGRFGWRGQVDHLHEFVLGACANELGLQVTRHAQPREVEFSETLNGRAILLQAEEKVDLTDSQCLSLSTFVGALLPPARSSAASNAHARDISAGEELFVEIRCTHCHKADIGPIQGIYSDLLLHDMGADLADPIGANPEQTSTFSGSGYFGGMAVPQIASKKEGKAPNLQQEWRTPPLWGVGDSAPYLHDGRATTLDEAIRLHRGQGTRSAREYVALKKVDRDRVLEFLTSLAAPRVDGTQPAAHVVKPPAPGQFPTQFGSFFGVGNGVIGFSP